MKRVGILPALVTAANGYLGLLSIYYTNDGKYYGAAWMILFAMVFDVLDGKVARMAGVTSRFGAYLDSLCDAISFGVAPAFLAKVVGEELSPWHWSPKLLSLLTMPYALCAIMRLARYNVEHASGEGSDREGKGVSQFAGMPTPGAAGVIAALVILACDPAAKYDLKFVHGLLPVLCLLLGALMVSRIPYAHLGSRFLQRRESLTYLFIVVILLGVLIKWPEESFAFLSVAYALSGPLLALLRKRTPKGEGGELEGPVDPEDMEIPEGL